MYKFGDYMKYMKYMKYMQYIKYILYMKYIKYMNYILSSDVLFSLIVKYNICATILCWNADYSIFWNVSGRICNSGLWFPLYEYVRVWGLAGDVVLVERGGSWALALAYSGGVVQVERVYDVGILVTVWLSFVWNRPLRSQRYMCGNSSGTVFSIKYEHLFYTSGFIISTACACRHSYVTSCQTPKYLARAMSIVKVRYGYVNKYFNLIYFKIIRWSKHILRWSL